MSPVRRGDALPIFNRIGVLRAERKMSRAQLAHLVDVNPQTVGALERGDHYPSLDLAFRICDVFDLPVEAVFSRTEFSPLSTEVYRLSTEVYRSGRLTEGSEKNSVPTKSETTESE
ncbi:helix-turn-helix transcriptional regulator [Rhodococcus sp. NPDC056743]|uniref:helix-turn-helix transcriptional regulator n=1 Tax=Rhodococcus sp. NPDC056743 TaxID=3345934 RepID=UPI00366F17FA